MPAPGTIDPTLTRDRLAWESDEAYAERMRRLDAREALIRNLFPAQPAEGVRS